MASNQLTLPGLEVPKPSVDWFKRIAFVFPFLFMALFVLATFIWPNR